jgi:hypothetical protein
MRSVKENSAGPEPPPAHARTQPIDPLRWSFTSARHPAAVRAIEGLTMSEYLFLLLLQACPQ